MWQSASPGLELCCGYPGGLGGLKGGREGGAQQSVQKAARSGGTTGRVPPAAKGSRSVSYAGAPTPFRASSGPPRSSSPSLPASTALSASPLSHLVSWVDGCGDPPTQNVGRPNFNMAAGSSIGEYLKPLGFQTEKGIPFLLVQSVVQSAVPFTSARCST